MHILHAVDNDPPDLFERLERAHGRDGVSLHEDIAVGEELDGLQYTAKKKAKSEQRLKQQRDDLEEQRDEKRARRATYLQCRSVRPDDSLTTLDESLLVPDDVSDLDDVAGGVVSEDLDGLKGGGKERREVNFCRLRWTRTQAQTAATTCDALWHLNEVVKAQRKEARPT